MKYVNLVIENKSDNTDNFYTYGCKFDDIKVGQKVYVPFNRGNKIKEAYVFQVMDTIDKEFSNLKYVESIDEDIELSEETIKTCIWMRKRYFCRYIDAVNLFLPSGSKAKRREKKETLDDYKELKDHIQKLTEEQEKALQEINKALESGRQELFLLQGVTGSGKTEVYIQAAAKTISQGKSVIVLVPEVTLTKQIIERFKNRFGSQNLAVLHSRLSQGERYDQWQKIKKGEAKIVIGARTGVFAPLDNIGLVILDEEHEDTYKSDKSPKYETVEIATKRAKYFGGSVIMGSATPSIVSQERAREGIYKKLKLENRYNDVKLPIVKIADMRAELKSGNRSVFSKELYDHIQIALEKKEQIILFINQRGYASFVSCRECGHTIKCPKCGIAMTYHKDQDKLVCHYCGDKMDIPKSCPICDSKYIRSFGAGTQKVLESAMEMFPEAKIERLDLDISKKAQDINKILNRFAKGKIDILVGTQMVAKGLDYKNVSLVGIVAADTILNLPDFRSSERTFQMITQAAGRAGRGDEQGKVVVQTYEPDNFAIQMGAKQDVEGFFKGEIQKRKLMNYPPFSDFVQISIMGKSKEEVRATSQIWLDNIKKSLGDKSIIAIKESIMGQAKQNNYRKFILIKYLKKDKKKFTGMAEFTKDYLKEKKSKCASIVDINPYSMWRS